MENRAGLTTSREADMQGYRCLTGIALAMAAALPAAAGEYGADFQQFCRGVQERYAYFDSRPVDWPAVCAHYGPLATAARSRDEFVSVLERALAQLADAHAHLATSTPASARLVPTDTDLLASWQGDEARIVAVRADSAAARHGLMPGMRVLEVDGVAVRAACATWEPRFLRAGTAQATRLHLRDWALNVALAGRQNGEPVRLRVGDQEPGRTVASVPGVARGTGLLEVRTAGQVTVLRPNNSLGDLALIAAFDAALDETLDRGVTALVLDLRDVPSGGNSTVARGLMGRLVARTSPYQMHEAVAEGVATGVRRVWVEQVLPRGRVFQGPVVVLVGPWTGSMGEGIAIGLHAARQAPVTGQPMAGLLGALEEFELPDSRITVRVPGEKLFHVEGAPRERFLPCPAPAVANGRGSPLDPGLDYALALARGDPGTPRCLAAPDGLDR
jgi:carboxyl-terminal processing protease